MFNKTKIATAISAIFLLGAAGATLAADTTTGTTTTNQH